MIWSVVTLKRNGKSQGSLTTQLNLHSLRLTSSCTTGCFGPCSITLHLGYFDISLTLLSSEIFAHKDAPIKRVPKWNSERKSMRSRHLYDIGMAEVAT